MIEQILSPRNLQRALRQVIANKGCAGVDGMKTSQLAMFFRKQQTFIMQEIRSHKYLPQPIMGVEIPKGMGKTRLLGVPTVIDRMLQQAVSQTIKKDGRSQDGHSVQFDFLGFSFRPLTFRLRK